MLNDSNLIEWLALKAFIINQVYNAIKFVIIFVFLYDIYFLLTHFYLNVIKRILNDTHQNKSYQFIAKDFH